MQVQSIQLYTMPKGLGMRECDPQSGNCEGVNGVNGVNIKSIYSRGMTNVAFGNAPKVMTCFEKEIAEQPEVLSKLIHKYFAKPGTVNLDINVGPAFCQLLKKIHIFASGSSKNAAEMAQNFMEKVTGVPVFVHSSSEAMYHMQPLDKVRDMAVFVSQSGGTADTYAVLNIAKKAGLPTVAITNNPDSKIAKGAESHIPLLSGEEKAVAATKTVTSSIFNLMALGMKLGELKGTLKKEDINMLAHNFVLLPSSIQLMLKKDKDVKNVAEVISRADNIYYYAKGASVGAAKEGALKLTETTGKRVIADASGEALHGTFASIKPEDVVLQIIGLDAGNIAKENIEEIARKRHVKNPIIMQDIGMDKNFKFENGVNPLVIEIPYIWSLGGEIAPLLATIRFQQITNEVTKKLGINPDNGGGFLTKFRQNMTM